MSNFQKPTVLIILDGFGYSEDTKYNAISKATTPHWDKFWQNSPHALIEGSGIDVGLPEGQMGNSEVGHLSLGSGRVLYQEFTRIQQAIQDGDFFSNSVLVNAIQTAIKKNKKIHILGLLSNGGVHSHESQIHAMVELANRQGAKDVYIHAFLDGRDTAPKSAADSIEKLQSHCHKLSCGKIASLIGRYYAMDRDQRFDRVAKAYHLLTKGKADFHAQSAIDGLTLAYERGETDEFVKATAIVDEHAQPISIEDDDVVIFMNYRADRARELSRAFLDEDFDGFPRKKLNLSHFVSLTQYAEDIHSEVAYPANFPKDTLGEYISNCGLKQLRIAETEKYAHVTFFFNGGKEQPFPGEDRILVPSPKVATYDLQPQMSAYEVTKHLQKAIKSDDYALIICNFANPDMVGHTGNFQATVKAIEVIDECLGQLATAIKEKQGQLLITADHGNAEKMFDDKLKSNHTAHTSNVVPLVYLGEKAKFKPIKGTLSDVAPTILYLMGLKQPDAMTGNNLIELLK